ncbi:hypothetical protein K438DRAFT_1781361 [Mycena galopus ATCC 62051]|nr:hypothetical protein K438DRAFT_1781361 [Mycena galopus ATCC 62051]
MRAGRDDACPRPDLEAAVRTTAVRCKALKGLEHILLECDAPGQTSRHAPFACFCGIFLLVCKLVQGMIVIVDIPDKTEKTDPFWSTVASTFALSSSNGLCGAYAGAGVYDKLRDAVAFDGEFEAHLPPKPWRMMAVEGAMRLGALTVGPIYAASAVWLPLHNYRTVQDGLYVLSLYPYFNSPFVAGGGLESSAKPFQMR